MPDTVVDLDRLLRTLVCAEATGFIKDLPMYRRKMNLRSTAVLFRNFGQIEGAGVAQMPGGVSETGLVAEGPAAGQGPRWKAHVKGRAQGLFPRVVVTLKTADVLLILEAGRLLRAGLLCRTD